MGIDTDQNCHSGTAPSIMGLVHQAKWCNLESYLRLKWQILVAKDKILYWSVIKYKDS